MFTEEHDFQIDPRDTRCTEEKREKSGTPWKEKNRERVKGGMRMRMAHCRETKKEIEREREERRKRRRGQGEKRRGEGRGIKVDVWMRKREGHISGEEREREGGKRGPVSVSLQFRAVVRRCTQPFAYESGSEERTEGPEACMWRP